MFHQKVNAKHNFTSALNSFSLQKIAVPVTNKKLCLQFEKCAFFLVYSIENQKLLLKDKLATQLKPDAVPYWLAKKGITDVIAYTINPQLVSKFNQFKINVFVGVKLFDPSKLINEFMRGTLETEDVLTKV